MRRLSLSSMFEEWPNWLIVTPILFLTVLVYINIIGHEFVWDDYHFILEWTTVRNLGDHWLDLFMGDLPVGKGYLYRPVRSIIQSVSISIWDKNPVGYQLQAIITQVLATLFVYFLSWEITQKKNISAISALLFGIHPVHVEQVSWITAHFDIMGAVMFFASFYYYIRFSKTKFTKYLRWSYILAALAFFTYELTLMLPVLIIWYELLLGQKPRSSWKPHIGYWLLFLSYWVLRWLILPDITKVGYVLDNQWVTALLMLVSIAKYWGLLIWPNHLSINHRLWNNFTGFYQLDKNNDIGYLFPSLFYWQISFSIVLILISIIAIFVLKKKHPMASFCLGWVFLSLLPVMQIIPMQTIFAEKYLYTASFGYVLLVGWFLSVLISNFDRTMTKFFVTLLLTLYTGFLGYKTMSRNQVWASNLSLWKQEAKTNKRSGYTFSNLAGAYFIENNLPLAITNYQIAIDLNSQDAGLRRKYAYILIQNKQYQDAINQLLISTKIDDSNYITYNLLGDAYLQVGDVSRSKNAYWRSAELNSSDKYAYEKLKVFFKTSF